MATRQLIQPHRRFTLRGTPCLMFHGVGAESGRYAVESDQFSSFLARIRQRGFAQVSVEEVAASQDSHTPRAGITFDDGLLSVYEQAFPRLLAAGMSADFFLCTALVGSPGYLSWPQVVEMQRAGMSFHSHGHHHYYLSHLPRALLLSELTQSHTILEDRLGRPAKCLAFPYGSYNRFSVAVAREAGFEIFCTSRPWPATAGVPLIHRIAVGQNTTLVEFDRILDGDPFIYSRHMARNVSLYPLKQLALRFAPSLLGARVTGEPA